MEETIEHSLLLQKLWTLVKLMYSPFLNLCKWFGERLRTTHYIYEYGHLIAFYISAIRCSIYAGTLEGFSFDSEEDGENIPKTSICRGDKNNKDEDPSNSKSKKRKEKSLVRYQVSWGPYYMIFAIEFSNVNKTVVLNV